MFLKEEQRASEASLSLNNERIQVEVEVHVKNITMEKPEEHDTSIIAVDDENAVEDKLRKLETEEGKKLHIPFPVIRETKTEKHEERRKQRGKGNVEEWLQIMLESNQEELEP